MTINKELIPTLLEQHTHKERLRQSVEVKIENEWCEQYLIESEAENIKSGILVELPDEGMGYRLIGPLRRGEEPRSLRPKAKSLLNIIETLWINDMIKKQLDPSEIRFSVTSLYRTREWQQQRIKSNIHVALVSPHQSGLAIDFDVNGYYSGISRTPINRQMEEFDHRVTDSLTTTLNHLEKQGYAHLIIEKGYRTNNFNNIEEYTTCLHLCAAPLFMYL